VTRITSNYIKYLISLWYAAYLTCVWTLSHVTIWYLPRNPGFWQEAASPDCRERSKIINHDVQFRVWIMTDNSHLRVYVLCVTAWAEGCCHKSTGPWEPRVYSFDATQKLKVSKRKENLKLKRYLWNITNMYHDFFRYHLAQTLTTFPMIIEKFLPHISDV